VLVFARAPVPGAAKTRLIPRLGAWRAARLQVRLTALAVRTAAACPIAELHVTPSVTHPYFRLLEKKFRIAVKRQSGHDLGERMSRAFEKALRLHAAVIVIGTDCPALAPRDLLRAARLLRGDCDAVFAPAEDGGYALIGLRKLRKELFCGIEWGGLHVLRDTLARAGSLRVRLLRTVWDVDRPEDLDRLRSLRSF
jgi:rSAM/selenodomain-associated transferase 1